MKTKIVRMAALVITLVSVGYMSISMSAESSTAGAATAVGGKGLTVGQKDQGASANAIEDQSSAGAVQQQVPEQKKGGCCAS